MVKKYLYYQNHQIVLDIIQENGKNRITEMGLLQLWEQLIPLVEDLRKKVNVPKPSESTNSPTPPKVFSEEQKRKMRELQAKLKIQDKNELNPLVQQWSLNKLTTYKELTPSNIDDFIAYLEQL